MIGKIQSWIDQLVAHGLGTQINGRSGVQIRGRASYLSSSLSIVMMTVYVFPLNVYLEWWGAVVLWAYSSANSAKGLGIKSQWRQKKNVYLEMRLNNKNHLN